MRLSRKILPLITASTVCLAGLLSVSAPIPATSSSQFMGSHQGLFRSELGFEISAHKTSWKQFQAPDSNKYINTIYKSPSIGSRGIHGALTVRTNTLLKNQNFSRYIQSWIKDYPRLGFTILAAKKVKVGDQPGFLIDLINRNSAKQLRQVLFHRGKQVVVLTCRDHKSQFLETVKSCNQIVRNFKWH